MDLEGYFPNGLFPSTDWLIIMIVCVAANILFSSIVYLSSHLYDSSIITGGSKDSDWKKGVDGAELLLKF